MHKKKAQDSRLLVYKYSVWNWLSWDDLPKPVQFEAWAMQDLWNSLVDLWDTQQQEYQAILSSVPAVAALEEQTAAAKAVWESAVTALKAARQQSRSRNPPDAKALTNTKTKTQRALKKLRVRLKAAKKAARKTTSKALTALREQFDGQIADAAKNASLDWANKQKVVDTFQTTVRNFFKGTSKPPKRKHGRPQEIHFHHRFTGGGLEIDKLWGKGERVHLEESYLNPGKKWPRMNFTFQVAGQQLPLTMTFHRPFPDPEPGKEPPKVKGVALIGRRVVRAGLGRAVDSGQGIVDRKKKSGLSTKHYSLVTLPERWRWSVQFTLELPALDEIERPGSEPVAALDLNYRLWDEGKRLRIGVLLDTEGHGESLFMPEKMLESWHYTRDLQRDADELLEETKAKLAQWWLDGPGRLPKEATEVLRSLSGVKSGGLWKLLAVLEKGEKGKREKGEKVLTSPLSPLRPFAPSPVAELRRWGRKTTFWLRKKRGLERRLLRWRFHQYRVLARDLCQKYRVLVLEALDLKAMAEQQDKEPRLAAAAKYRQWAGLSWLRLYLKQAAAKYGTVLIEVDPAGTTIECPRCGAVAENTGEVWLECPKGHRYESDIGAAVTMLRRAGYLVGYPGGGRKRAAA